MLLDICIVICLLADHGLKSTLISQPKQNHNITSCPSSPPKAELNSRTAEQANTLHDPDTRQLPTSRPVHWDAQTLAASFRQSFLTHRCGGQPFQSCHLYSYRRRPISRPRAKANLYQTSMLIAIVKRRQDRWPIMFGRRYMGKKHVEDLMIIQIRV